MNQPRIFSKFLVRQSKHIIKIIRTLSLHLKIIHEIIILKKGCDAHFRVNNEIIDLDRSVKAVKQSKMTNDLILMTLHRISFKRV